MPTDTRTEQGEPKVEAGMFTKTSIDVMPHKGVAEKKVSLPYKLRYTTGPFLLPASSGSLDWTLLNNDSTTQRARITVFKCPVGAVKTAVAPGPIVVTLDPGESTHNANEYPEGFAYEVQVECDSPLLFPYASVWPAHFGVVVPGTGISAGAFIRQLP